MRTSKMIRQAIAVKPPGAVFSSADFLSVGTRAAVDQALFRMMSAGIIERVARGLYAKAGQRVDAQTIAHAVAQKTGNKWALRHPEGQMVCWWCPLLVCLAPSKPLGTPCNFAA